jgi:hypothetical protein
VVALTYIPPRVCKDYFFHTSSLAVIVVCFIHCHSDIIEMESQCCFDLHFLHGEGCGIFLNIFISHLLLELLIQLIYPFINWIAFSLGV